MSHAGRNARRRSVRLAGMAGSLQRAAPAGNPSRPGLHKQDRRLICARPMCSPCLEATYCKMHYVVLWGVQEEIMRRAAHRKDHPLSMRLPEADIAIIDRAATLRGRSRTDFVREAAVRAAEDALMETLPIRMSAAGFKAFVAALSEPPEPVPEMVELVRRATPWETGGPKRAG